MISKEQVSSCSTMLRRLISIVAATAFLGIAGTMPAYAQGADTFAPVIELEEMAESVADRTQVFTVQIAEDVLLKDATLYYRREGQLPFTPAPMDPLSDTGYFSVSIPTSTTDLRTIEYYVQARDEAGNRTVSGFAFAPYKRVLTASVDIKPIESSSSTKSLAEPPGVNPPLLKRRWVQITLGVLAVGALASLASDEGGSDSEVVPLTFNLQGD